MGRNFFELCNDALDCMVYTQAQKFEDLDKTTEGRMVKKIINRNLRTICGGEQSIWKFREKVKNIYMVGGMSKYDMPNGFVLFVRPDDNTNRIPLQLNQDWNYLPLTATGTPVQYWIYENKINVFPTPTKDMQGDKYKIHYLTNNFAIDNYGCEKDILRDETDEPIIPEEYRDLLVYGAAKDFRANRADAKAAFYDEKYKELYRNMLYNEVLTEDYIKGGSIARYPLSNLQAKLDAFYNPYVQGRLHK
jgi:hypothetical protein